MTAKYADFKELMTRELTDFVQSQASVLSVADLDRLIADWPALRERFSTIPSQTYPKPSPVANRPVVASALSILDQI